MTTADKLAEGNLVPDRFEDLQRDGPEDRARFATVEVERRIARTQGLIGDSAFMDLSGRVSRWATVVGVLLILAGARAPLWDAIRAAPGLAEAVGAMGVDAVAALRPMALGLFARAQALKADDERGIDLARHGLACLNGTGACPAGRSPLR